MCVCVCVHVIHVCAYVYANQPAPLLVKSVKNKMLKDVGMLVPKKQDLKPELCSEQLIVI